MLCVCVCVRLSIGFLKVKNSEPYLFHWLIGGSEGVNNGHRVGKHVTLLVTQPSCLSISRTSNAGSGGRTTRHDRGTHARHVCTSGRTQGEIRRCRTITRRRRWNLNLKFSPRVPWSFLWEGGWSFYHPLPESRKALSLL